MKKRTRNLTLFLVLVFIGIASRLFWLQIFNYRVYEAQASRQQTVTKTLFAKRGEILVHEKDHTVPVATTKEGWLLSIDPRRITNPEELYINLMRLGPITMPKDEFLLKASKKDDPYEVIEHRVSNATKKNIEDAHLKGIGFALERWRFYPAGDFLSHVIGFVGGEDKGQYGLEEYYDRDLVGENGVFKGDKSVGGTIVRLGKWITQPEKDGTNIVLTIDAGVQAYIERTLDDVMSTYHARSAGAIVLNPQTGRIIAMASSPSFDPNNYSKTGSVAVFQNPLVEDLFEMGSVFKPLTMAAALDAGAVNLNTTYVDTGKRTIDGLTIENFDGKARGRVPMQEILSQSLNLGSVFVMEQLGKDRFRSYMQEYGLGEKTGIDLPNEVKGNLKNLESPRLIEYATAAFGQGVSVTSLELVRALSSLGNGGLLINPYLVEELQYENGSHLPKIKELPKRVLKEETSKTITRMLVEVVDTKLANGKGKIPGYSVAAKTGTAQIASLNSRGYSGDFMHTFFGYGPAYDPQFLVFFYLERPQGIRYASESLTEPFRSTMKYLFSYFEVPPDRPQDFIKK